MFHFLVLFFFFWRKISSVQNFTLNQLALCQVYLSITAENLKLLGPGVRKSCLNLRFFESFLLNFEHFWPMLKQRLKAKSPGVFELTPIVLD